MKLSTLLEGVEYSLYRGNGELIEKDSEAFKEALLTDIPSIANDSRKIEENSLFFCIVGANRDGHEFAREALQKKAAALIVSRIDLFTEEDENAEDILLIKTDDTRYAMAFVAAHFYGDPAKRLRVIGVTGTKGKTTTTYMIRSMLNSAGIKTGLIGTIEITYGDVHIPAGNTTPESVTLQKTFRDMAESGVEAVAMEVSSQALMLHRTQGFLFDIGVFTNLTPDHIGPNEHESFEEYLDCKRRLFSQCRIGIVNGDDKHANEILEGHTCTVETFGLEQDRDLYATMLTLIKKPGELGIMFTTNCKNTEDKLHDVNGWEARLPGAYNVYNSLCAIAVCRHFIEDVDMMQKALTKTSVKGRIEIVPVPGEYTLLIDYAHNAIALESVLRTLREYRPNRILCLFGCGGNRAKSRRFEMGEVSGRLADLTIITSDNPRFEEPLEIMADIKTGVLKTEGEYVEIPDRKEAIRYAMRHAEKKDIILLAGKGHEDYQEIKGAKYPLDERVLIREILEEDA